MASLYGSEYTDILETTPSVKVDVSKWGGRRRVAYGSYTLLADASANDKIYMCQLPPGAIVYGVTLAAGALGGSCTLDAGYEFNGALDSALTGVADDFIAAGAFSSAATVSMSGQANKAGFGLNAGNKQPMDVVVTFHASSSGATGKVIKIAVDYVVD